MTRSIEIYKDPENPEKSDGPSVSKKCKEFSLHNVNSNCDMKRRQRQKEYKNLKKVLPTLSRSPKVSKRDIIEEAIKYIDYLHNEVTNRFYTEDGVFNEEKESSPVAECVKRLFGTELSRPDNVTHITGDNVNINNDAISRTLHAPLRI